MIIVDKINNDIRNKNITLSAVLNADSFFYSLIHEESDGLRQLHGQELKSDKEEYSLKSVVDNFLMSDAGEHPGISKVKVAFRTANFTLVPKEIYLEDEHATYFQNLSYLTSRDKVLSLPLDHLDSMFLFTIDQYLLNRILTKWPDAQIYHAAYPLLKKQLEWSKQTSDNRMYIHVVNGMAYLTVFRNSRLQHFAPFNFENSDDFIYHILLMYKNFDFDRSQDELYVSGQLTQKSTIIQDLMKYIYHIEFIEFDQAESFNALDHTRPPHFYFDLFSIASCGS